jgi:Asp-tRNA(Asn)/Glu-tRNA(Gln) amidotransferase A subunit family amidase
VTDFRSLTVREAARQIADRRLTAEALVRAYLDRIETRETVVGAWQFFDHERALAAARQRAPSRRGDRSTGFQSPSRI